MGRLAQTLGHTGENLPISMPKAVNTEVEDPSFFEQLEVRRTQALVIRDLDLIVKLHSKDYKLITPSGRSFDRDRYVNAIKEAPFYSSWEIAEFRCRVATDMAVVRYKARLTFPSGRVVNCWHTDTYEKGSDAWQAVWSQATEFTAQ